MPLGVAMIATPVLDISDETAIVIAIVSPGLKMPGSKFSPMALDHSPLSGGGAW